MHAVGLTQVALGTSRPPSSPRTVVVLDASPAGRRYLAAVLRLAGHDVVEASTASEVCEAAERGPIALVAAAGCHGAATADLLDTPVVVVVAGESADVLVTKVRAALTE